MTITLSDETVFNPIVVTGGSQYVQGVNRDSLTFVFDESTSMDYIDGRFTDIACDTITILNEETNEEYVHRGYTVRAELKKYVEKVTAETSDEEEQTVTRISVTMAQRTYSETKLQAISDAVDMLCM